MHRIFEDLAYLKQWSTDLKKKSTLKVHSCMILELVKVGITMSSQEQLYWYACLLQTISSLHLNYVRKINRQLPSLQAHSRTRTNGWLCWPQYSLEGVASLVAVMSSSKLNVCLALMNDYWMPSYVKWNKIFASYYQSHRNTGNDNVAYCMMSCHCDTHLDE